eukprot:TRINITY_DN67715_c5_g1_i2.p1 TRINITY_DN67715_c5_g1~~TRINITY_DN67715_c5_g1_i2.p1  ORF type:complete len:238 (-),score=30.88 TRINITY_DN67715_c5_g1_i2:61-774(-)
MTDPGAVPEDWFVSSNEAKANFKNSSKVLKNWETKWNGRLRFCKRCKCFKPDRAHHDSNSDRCVLKMDHHCPWVNNSIGHANHKFFLLTLSYLDMCTLYMTLTSQGQLVQTLHTLFVPGSTVSIPLIMKHVNFLMCDMSNVFLSICLTLFLAFHLGLVAKNTTTIEMLEKEQKFKIQGSQGMYNLGLKENFVSVFGTTWWKWLLPIPTTPGKGVYFPVRFEFAEDAARKKARTNMNV